MHSEGLEAVGEDVTSNSTYDVKAVNISNETRSSGSDHSSSVVGTATGSLPIDEQCVELHLTYPKNQRPSRCRNFLYELKVLFHLSWPICLSSFLEQTLFQLVVSIFCGHSSTHVYAAFVAAVSLVNILGTAFILGISTAADTLFAQFYGAGRYKEMGYTLQKAILIYIPYILACSGFFIVGDWILILCSFESSIAVTAGFFLKISILGLPAEFLSVLLGKFIQCQGRVIPSVIANIISNIVNALLCYVFIFGCDWGVVGAALAICLSMTVLSVVYYVMIILLKLHKQTWPGWHWSAVYGWGQYVRLALPGTVMIVSEWVLFEIGAILAGTIDSHNLSVQGILYEFSTSLSMWSFGVSYAASIRVGNLLGAGDLASVRRTPFAALILSVSVIIVLLIITLAFRTKLAYVIISDDEVASHISKLVPYLIWCAFTDCVATVNLGILSGCGRQCIGAINNFIGYYVITLPLSISLMFFADMGLEGYWLGLSTGSTIQSVFLFIFVVRINWEKEVGIAKERVEKEFMKPAALLGHGRVGSAVGLARYKSRSNFSQSVGTLPFSRGRFDDFDISSEIIRSYALRFSTPELATPSSMADIVGGGGGVRYENLGSNGSEIKVATVSASNNVASSSTASRSQESFFRRYVPFVSFKCQLLKLFYYFISIAILLSAIAVAILFPVVAENNHEK